jgi:hypothetical protein
MSLVRDPFPGPVRVTMDQHLGDGSWATADEVAIACDSRQVLHLLRNMDGYSTWWPWMHVNLSVHTAVGIGSEGTMAFGPLKRPRWRFRVVEIREPSFIQYDFRGDLVGRAAWEIEPHGALTAVRFCWYAVQPTSRLARMLVRITEVRWHHLWVRTGLMGLKARLERGGARSH